MTLDGSGYWILKKEEGPTLEGDGAAMSVYISESEHDMTHSSSWTRTSKKAYPPPSHARRCRFAACPDPQRREADKRNASQEAQVAAFGRQ